MISDVLSQVVADLDRYLSDPEFDNVHVGETRQRLRRLCDDADNLRSVLDMPPVPAPTADDGPQQADTTPSIVDRMMSEETAFEIATPFFSRSDLLKRSWTKGLVDRLLGPPDWTTKNPHGPGFSLMQCYRQDRVVAVEASLAFPPSRRKIQDERVAAPG